MDNNSNITGVSRGNCQTWQLTRYEWLVIHRVKRVVAEAELLRGSATPPYPPMADFDQKKIYFRIGILRSFPKWYEPEISEKMDIWYSITAFLKPHKIRKIGLFISFLFLFYIWIFGMIWDSTICHLLDNSKKKFVWLLQPLVCTPPKSGTITELRFPYFCSVLLMLCFFCLRVSGRPGGA